MSRSLLGLVIGFSQDHDIVFLSCVDLNKGFNCEWHIAIFGSLRLECFCARFNPFLSCVFECIVVHAVMFNTTSGSKGMAFIKLHVANRPFNKNGCGEISIVDS